MQAQPGFSYAIQKRYEKSKGKLFAVCQRAADAQVSRRQFSGPPVPLRVLSHFPSRSCFTILNCRMEKHPDRSLLGRMKKKVGWNHSRSNEEHKGTPGSSAALPASTKQLTVPDEPSRASSTLPEPRKTVPGDAEQNVATQSKDKSSPLGENGGGPVRSDAQNESKPPAPVNGRSSTLWDLAFEQLGQADQDLIDEYQKVLSKELNEKSLYLSWTLYIDGTYMVQILLRIRLDSSLQIYLKKGRKMLKSKSP